MSIEKFYALASVSEEHPVEKVGLWINAKVGDKNLQVKIICHNLDFFQIQVELSCTADSWTSLCMWN